jgi:type VI secretion system protein ImpJ
MSRYSKVAWKEGLFLKPHHLQQSDRYLEKLVAARCFPLASFSWGVLDLAFDSGQLMQGRLELQKATGIFQDGTPFDCPASSPLPVEISTGEGSIGKTVWLTLPNAAQNGRDVGMLENKETRYVIREEEGIADNASPNRNDEIVEIATPRLELAIRSSAPEGYQSIPIAVISDISDNKVVTLDPNTPPVGLTINCHNAYASFVKTVIGIVEAKLEVLERYAADPTSGGGMQNKDYLLLLVLNRALPILRHQQKLPVVHPERLYETLISLAGELTSFEDRNRQVKDYGRYRHDKPKETFRPVIDDIRRMLARDVGRAIQLPLTDRGGNRFAVVLSDPSLFATAQFIIEVKADLPLTRIQQQFPQYCKVGPGARIREIIINNIPGIPVIHTPNPPPQIRHVANHVYFSIDKNTPLWREFSVTPAIGMQLAGSWPGLTLEMWAIPEE